jgi:hypothetical protein
LGQREKGEGEGRGKGGGRGGERREVREKGWGKGRREGKGKGNIYKFLLKVQKFIPKILVLRDPSKFFDFVFFAPHIGVFDYFY